jgi:hypothetical protein
MPSGESYSWTQPLCDRCWLEYDQTGRDAIRARGDVETCVHCGESTSSGIYVRINPDGPFARYPTARQ